MTRIFALELGVEHELQVVRDLLSLDAADYGGNPAQLGVVWPEAACDLRRERMKGELLRVGEQSLRPLTLTSLLAESQPA